ncbi:metal resistance protein Ycf1p [Trichomonascus vanleenenianus]|uniref:metal resistance protein Ycf1p n=1 Tax=Trichomonascus vanleenenianus TaxID=2268995 RepID=UPI003EC96E47
MDVPLSQLRLDAGARLGFCASPNNWLLPSGSLSPCFIDGPLLLIPNLLVLIVGPLSLYRLYKKRTSNRPAKWIVKTKIALLLILIAVVAAAAGSLFYELGLEYRPLTLAVWAFTLVAVPLNLYLLETQRKSTVPSGLLLVYWPLIFVASAIKVYHIFLGSYYSAPFDQTVAHCFILAAEFGIFQFEYIIPQFVKGKPDENLEASSEEEDHALLDNASIYSHISLSWMNPIIAKATRAELAAHALPNVDKSFNTDVHSDKFFKHWSNRRDDSLFSLVWSLVKSFGPTLLIGAIFEILYDLAGYVHPFLLRYLILFANSYYDEGKEDIKPQPIQIGFYIAMAMFVSSVAQTVLGSGMMLFTIRTAAGAKSALLNAIYRKSLQISAKERGRRSTGEIVNLMAVDVWAITSMCFMITVLWESPFQFIICLYALHKLLGASMWSVLAILCVFLPVNWFVSRMIKKMRRQQMRYKDQRTRLTTEIMTNSKSLKLYAWEHALLERLDYVRNQLQLKSLKTLIYASSVVDFIWSLVPYLFSGATFALFVYIEDVPLTTDIVFPAMALFNMMTGPISEIPRFITTFVDSGVSFSRVRDFLVSDEIQENAVTRLPAVPEGEESISLKDVTMRWDKYGDAIFENFNLSVNHGQLCCIVGKVGTGKTSLMRSLLGDLYKDTGEITVKGSLAYVSQDPWLMNASVKENIIFGGKFDPEYYYKTIDACALSPDLDVLPDGDDTEIGERGVSLSGGQKARLSLARAVYARADIYLMDDPLSAVDEHVGRHIIDSVLGPDGLLSGKTRVLATNALNVLSHADNIILLENRAIAEQGSFAEVMSQTGKLNALIEEFGRHSKQDDSQPSDLVDIDSDTSSNTSSGTSADIATLTSSVEQLTGLAPSEPLLSETTGRSPVKSRKPKRRHIKTKKIIEKGQIGHVRFNVYKRYAASCGVVPLVLSFAAMLGASLITLAGTFWLKYWVESNARHGYNYMPQFWIGGFLFLGFMAAVFVVIRRVVTRILCGLRASRKLHDEMAVAVLRSPMSFFETTPVGRIINRFSGDVNELDEGLPVAFIDLVRTIIRLCLSLIVVIVSAPIILPVAIPLGFLYNYYQKYYQSASRELKRMLSISKSPIFSHFQESLNGVSTIRAFNQLQRFEQLNEKNIDANIRAQFLFRSTNRWLSFRLQTIGAAIVLATASTIVVGASKKAFTPGMIGIVMTYTLEVTDYLNRLVRSIVNLETSIVGAERVLEYCDLPSEAPEIIEGHRPPAYWPHEGTIEFKHYSTQYRKNLDLVLKNVSFSVGSKEKIGVVGRTGAGKTSLVMALFRIIEPTAGTIEVDGLDITKMGLLDLRSNLSIIPQDSQVFDGTLRQNLDPFNKYDDTELWRALELSHLKAHIEGMGGLDTVISEGGSNLSFGQRQLMCLSRALLHPSNILVLDEATASVDVQTDRLIQETIKNEFSQKTIFTIAHRLHTLTDSTKVMVMDAGTVAECGSPRELYSIRNSLFRSLCDQAGLTLDDFAN